ncbi:MAG: TraR/DksA family transcriptional regulator [Acidimicrobiales bacterium]
MPKSPKTAVAAKKPAPSRAKAGTAQSSRRRTPAATKGGVTAADRFLDEQRALLLAEREASLRQADSLRAEAEQLAEEMEPGDTQFDEESGEGATLNVERERDLALSAQARAAADEIDVALAKVARGTYGTCERCGQPIPRARLKAMPSAALCVGCKSGGLSRR